MSTNNSSENQPNQKLKDDNLGRDSKPSPKSDLDAFWNKFEGFEDKAEDVSSNIDKYLYGEKK